MISNKFILILLIFSLLFSRHDCRLDDTVNPFFEVETTDNEDLTINYPLFTNKLNFGVKLISHYCPRIVFSNHAQNASATPALIVYICSSSCVLKSSKTDLLSKPFRGLAADKYKSFYISIDQSKGIIIFGESDEEKPLIEYTYTNRPEFKDDFLSYYAVGGFARWIIEKNTDYLLAESVNSEYATSFYSLLQNKVYFGMKFSSKDLTIKKCPRIEFHDRSVKNDPHFFSFFTCKSTYGVTDGPKILQEMPGELVNRERYTSFWMNLNQKSKTLSVGRNYNATPFFQYYYNSTFKNIMFTSYSFVGFMKLILP